MTGRLRYHRPCIAAILKNFKLSLGVLRVLFDIVDGTTHPVTVAAEYKRPSTGSITYMLGLEQIFEQPQRQVFYRINTSLPPTAWHRTCEPVWVKLAPIIQARLVSCSAGTAAAVTRVMGL